MPATPLTFRPIGGPTALLEIAGLAVLIDPTFDPPGSYPTPAGTTLVKTAGPAVEAGDLEPIDVVLVSHEQHADNLDDAGRAVAKAAPLVISTPASAEALGASAVGLAPWAAHDVPTPDGPPLQVTVVPAQHGPNDRAHLMGDVAGFVLERDDIPTVYVSGDNASVDVVEEIAGRFPDIAVAVLFAGGAQSSLLGDAYLTLSSALAVEATRALGSPLVLPVHTDGWAHFSDDGASLRSAFADAGLDSLLVDAAPGEAIDVLARL